LFVCVCLFVCVIIDALCNGWPFIVLNKDDKNVQDSHYVYIHKQQIDTLHTVKTGRYSVAPNKNIGFWSENINERDCLEGLGNTKMDLKETEWQGVDCIHTVQLR